MNPTPKYIDIGANLTHKSFRHDLPDVIRAGRDHGVSQIVVTGTSHRSSTEAARLALCYPGTLFSTAGIHPHDAREFEPDPDVGSTALLEKLARQEPVVAIGECGLDFNRNFSSREAQFACFEAQLALASRLAIPLFLHERDAHGAFMDILTRHRDRCGCAAVHCFTGTRAELRAYLDLDLHIGITGWICDERRGAHLRELVGEIPANRLMVETDAPFLAPRDLPEKIRRNEPKYLPHIVQVIAGCRGQSPESLAEGATATAAEFFNLPHAP